MNDIFNAGQRPNQLYYMGRKRVGCDPCIQSNHLEIKAAVKYSSDTIERLKLAESKIGSSFFPPKYIPSRFCSGIDKKGKRFPFVTDVINYLCGSDYNPELFSHVEEPHNCMSFYNICE